MLGFYLIVAFAKTEFLSEDLSLKDMVWRYMLWIQGQESSGAQLSIPLFRC